MALYCELMNCNGCIGTALHFFDLFLKFKYFKKLVRSKEENAEQFSTDELLFLLQEEHFCLAWGREHRLCYGTHVGTTVLSI